SVRDTPRAPRHLLRPYAPPPSPAPGKVANSPGMRASMRRTTISARAAGSSGSAAPGAPSITLAATRNGPLAAKMLTLGAGCVTPAGVGPFAAAGAAAPARPFDVTPAGPVGASGPCGRAEVTAGGVSRRETAAATPAATASNAASFVRHAVTGLPPGGKAGR